MSKFNRSSTANRKNLDYFINSFGNRIPRVYSTYYRNDTKYRVYIRSGYRSEYYLYSLTYNIRVIRSK